MRKHKLIIILTLVLAALLHFDINAQNSTLTRTEGHFVANLDFIPNSGVYNQRKNRVNPPFFTPYFPQDFTENNITVKEMVKGAVLSMDWWTLFGEPVENYNFQWTSTGKYHISEYGGRLNMTVTRDMVSKYPDLLMRFDALKPLDIKFKIYWKHSNEAYKDRLHYTFSSSNRNQSVTTNVTTGLLFEPSGKNPLSVPGIRQEKGLEFIDKMFDNYKHYDLNDEVKKTWLAEFNKANNIVIDAYYVTEIRWPVGEMKAIAELYDKYEKGEVDPTPIQLIENDLKKSQSLATYNREDFWSDAYENDIKSLEIFLDNQKFIIGIKTNNKITYQRKRTGFITELIKIPQTKNYFLDVSLDNSIPYTHRLIKIIDNQGRKIVVDEIPTIFDYRILEDGNLYLYKKLNSFTKVKFGQFRNLNLYTNSSGKLKSFLIEKGYLLEEFTTNRNQLEKTIRDLFFESTNTYEKEANKWWGVGEFMEYKLNQNLEVIGNRIVFFTYYQ